MLFVVIKLVNVDIRVYISLYFLIFYIIVEAFNAPLNL